MNEIFYIKGESLFYLWFADIAAVISVNLFLFSTFFLILFILATKQQVSFIPIIEAYIYIIIHDACERCGIICKFLHFLILWLSFASYLNLFELINVGQVKDPNTQFYHSIAIDKRNREQN